MDQLSGSLQDRSLFEVIERVRAGQRSGTLQVRSGGQTRRFTFLDGDLYLPAGHALAQQMGRLLEAEASWLSRSPAGSDAVGAAEPEHRAPLRALIGRIAELLGQLREGEFVFHDGPPPQDPEDLVGPIWSTCLVVEGAEPRVAGKELLALLGGEDALVVGRAGADGMRRLDVLGPQPGAMLRQVEAPASLGDLARRGGEAALATVHRLRTAGLVTVLGPGIDRATKGALGATGTTLAPALAERLSDRVAQSLLRDPLQQDPGSQRREIADLLSRLGSLDHYELLGLTPLADDRQVHEAFERLGRLVHPFNAPRLQWIGREGILRLLFERATTAYAVLSDPVRRSDYNREAGIGLGVEVSAERRQQEVEELAQQCYQRACQHAEQEDYFLAVELLGQAISYQPRAEYYALLGRIQRRNPKWLRQAQDSFRRAIQLSPDDLELRIELARLQERAGEAEGAKASYRAVLERNAADPAASAALRRLERYAATGRVSAAVGWLERLFGWLRKGPRIR